MFRVFRVLGFRFRVNDILEGQKGDQGGRPKNGQNFRWGEVSPFWASSSAKKVLPTAENVGSAKIDENIGWGKTRTSLKLPCCVLLCAVVCCCVLLVFFHHLHLRRTPLAGPHKISLFFFSLSHPCFVLFLSLSQAVLIEFWWCLKARALMCARLGFLGCRVKPGLAQIGQIRMAKTGLAKVGVFPFSLAILPGHRDTPHCTVATARTSGAD